VTGQQNWIFILEDLVSTKTIRRERRELHKSNIHGRAAIAKSLITESNGVWYGQRTSFLLVTVGSSTVQLHYSVGSTHICAYLEAGVSANVLEECTTGEQRSVLRFYWQNDSMQRIFVNKCLLFAVGSVCRVKPFTTGSRNDLRDVRKSQMKPDSVRKWLRMSHVLRLISICDLFTDPPS
jgi:hypothetical protein